MNEDVIETSRAGAHEERERAELEHQSDLVVIDPLRAPARDLHETWREDAAKTVGQLVSEGVDRKEAARRVRWARLQAKRMAEAVAFAEALTTNRAARRSARLPGGSETRPPADTRTGGHEVEEDGTEGFR